MSSRQLAPGREVQVQICRSAVWGLGWDGMRVRGTILVAREETTYIEILLGFRIQGEAWRESLGAPEKETSERKKSRWKSRLLECPCVRRKPGLVGARGQLWGTGCTGSGWVEAVCGVQTMLPLGTWREGWRSTCRDSVLICGGEGCPFPGRWDRPCWHTTVFPARRRLPRARHLPSRADTARWAWFSSEPGPHLEPRVSLCLPALSQKPEWVTLSPVPLSWDCPRFGAKLSPCAFLH